MNLIHLHLGIDLKISPNLRLTFRLNYNWACSFEKCVLS